MADIKFKMADIKFKMADIKFKMADIKFKMADMFRMYNFENIFSSDTMPNFEQEKCLAYVIMCLKGTVNLMFIFKQLSI